MQVCPECKGAIPESVRFCGFCGHEISSFEGSAGMTQKDLKAADIKYNLGVVYFKKGKYAQALEVFEALLASQPGDLRLLHMIEKTREKLQEVESSKP